ncbi:MAG: type I restriction enzyme HsdR N-terminal domain-containing protein [Bacteroidia bacterium]|nr:type I restriction enzyme HsdR N-terminal domain-containing protein [Bacteroidia bacterium]
MKIDLSTYHQYLKIERRARERYIFDPIRKKFFIVRPEELVRQSWIQYLLHEKEISPSSIAVEKQVKVFGDQKRFDLLLYMKGKPRILFEFKSFKAAITEQVCRQIAVYNMELKVPLLLISNGLVHHMFKVDFTSGNIEELSEFQVKQ